MKKRQVMKKVSIIWLLLFFSIIFFSGIVSAAVGITPAKIEFNFVPGATYDFDYRLDSDNVEREIQLYAGGDLAEYVTLSRSVCYGSCTFNVHLELPADIDQPGKQTIFIGAREVPTQDAFLGGFIDIRGIIRVFVPYPGRYAEATLGISDINANETFSFELNTINRGKENLSVETSVDIVALDTGETVHAFSFAPRDIAIGESATFTDSLEAGVLQPGDYMAHASVLYGDDETRVNETFRVGSLFVNITNFTRVVEKGGIQKFFVTVQSNWNGELPDVFAEVILSRGVEGFTFKTPPVNLKSWEETVLTGFIETDTLSGVYDMNIIVHYAGAEQYASGKLTLTEFNTTLLISVGLGVIALLFIGAIVFLLLGGKKSKKRTRGKKK